MSSQNFSFVFIGALALISLSLPSTALSQGAFLKNLQPLDDEIRGYCLDVRRAPPNVDLEGRLGTHACKYGLENVDQQFEWRDPDQLYLPEYDRCLTAAGFDAGSELFARSCADTEEQSWVVNADGRITPTSRPDLCMTLSAEQRVAGTPSWISPVFHARDITLETCAEAAHARQQFRFSPVTDQPLAIARQTGDTMPAELGAAIRRVSEQGVAAAETAPLYADQPRVYALEEIEVAGNLSYGPHERNLLDVHTGNRRRSDGPMPVVMYFHGGGFVRGNKDGNRNVADYFASLGLVGVNATYRLVPQAKFPDGANDVGAAVAWVKDNIAEYGGDPNLIFVIGKSAAASHAATYAFRPDVLEPGTPAAAGVILVSGGYGADPADASENRIAYFGEDLSRWPEISTIGNIERTDIPVMFTISEFDNPGTQESLMAIMNEVSAKQGGMPRVVQLIGHNHYSPNLSIGTQDTQLSATILQFIRATVADHKQMAAR